MNQDLIETAVQPKNTIENQPVAPRVENTARVAFFAARFPGLVSFRELTIYVKPDQISAERQSGYRDNFTSMDGEYYPTSVADRTFKPAQPGKCFGGRVDADPVAATPHARSEPSISHSGSMHPEWPSVLGVIS